MAVTVTSPFIRSVKAISAESISNTETIFTSRLMLNLYFILPFQHFPDRFHEGIDVTCANCGAPYHDELKQPKVTGVCDVCGSSDFKRRPDDNEQTVRTRMGEYRAKTAPILPYYQQRGLVRTVDGMAGVSEVAAAIDTILDR